MMATNDPTYWERAWRYYREPLERDHPDHEHKAEVTKFKQQLDAHRQREEGVLVSEGQRLFLLGDRLRQNGQWAEARQVWKNVADVFGGVESEKEWVRKAEKGLAELQ